MGKAPLGHAARRNRTGATTSTKGKDLMNAFITKTFITPIKTLDNTDHVTACELPDKL